MFPAIFRALLCSIGIRALLFHARGYPMNCVACFSLQSNSQQLDKVSLHTGQPSNVLLAVSSYEIPFLQSTRCFRLSWDTWGEVLAGYPSSRGSPIRGHAIHSQNPSVL